MPVLMSWATSADLRWLCFQLQSTMKFPSMILTTAAGQKAAISSRRALVLLLLLLLLLLGHASGEQSNSNISQLGPIRLTPSLSKRSSSNNNKDPQQKRSPRAAYTWQASVDRTAGKAYSREVSNVPANSRLARAVAKINDSDDDGLLRMATRMFGDYPVWLCRFPTTLGVLKAQKDHGGYRVTTRLLGINLISFGAPQSHRISYNTNAIPNSSNDSSNGNEPSTSSQVSSSVSTDCTVVLPITGGILSRAAAPSSTSWWRRGDEDRGSLVFSLKSVRTTTITSSEPQAAERPWHEMDDAATTTRTTTTSTSTRSSIVTALSGYRPSLCGGITTNGGGGKAGVTKTKRRKINPLRAGFYLGTQSVVHGHIMWRFHRHCRRYGAK